MKIAEFRHYELHSCENGKMFCFGTVREHQGKDSGIPVNQYGTKEEIIHRLKRFIEIDLYYQEKAPQLQEFFPSIEMYRHFLSVLESI